MGRTRIFFCKPISISLLVYKNNNNKHDTNKLEMIVLDGFIILCYLDFNITGSHRFDDKVISIENKASQKQKEI